MIEGFEDLRFKLEAITVWRGEIELSEERDWEAEGLPGFWMVRCGEEDKGEG